MDEKFELKSPYKPAGDQPQAIEKLVEGVKEGLKDQVLLGVTGSGKTFTMAKDHTVLRRNAMGTEVWTINYDNVVLNRMKEQNNLQVRLSETKS